MRRLLLVLGLVLALALLIWLLLRERPVVVQTSGSFTTLSYNVAGLLEPFSGSNPAVNTPIISCLLPDYDLVQVQEDFNYHADLYSCDDHPHRSLTSGGMGFGSGLNTLSDMPYTDFVRITWNTCNFIDCLTPKGFTLARVELAQGSYVDVYNLHAQAEQTSLARAARRAQIRQLARSIENESAGNAVIVMGDTNSRYTRDTDNLRELLVRGFRDVWVELRRSGSVPPFADSTLKSCEPAADGPDCELVDKLLFRSNAFVTLSAADYAVENQRFVDSAGADLSDHWPLKATWNWSTASNRRYSGQWGGEQGRSFDDIALLPSDPAPRTLGLRAGSRVDEIGLTLSNGWVLSHGGTGGTLRTLALTGSEYLKSIYLCSGLYGGETRIFHARLTTSANATLSGGNSTATCTTYTAPGNWQIVGFHGRSGANVDKLGVIYAPVATGTPPGPAAYFSIVNRQSGLCMDVQGAQMADGTDVLQWTCHGQAWQKWSHDPSTGLIRSRHDPRFCLDNSGSFEDGADIVIRRCSGNANQRFDADAASGVIRMRTLALQVVAAASVSGNDLITSSDQGIASQRWNFVP
jgi:hypothetical protein